MTGDRCPTCGREPTVVEDDTEDTPDPLGPLRSVPRAVWIGLVVVVVAVAFALLRSGFHFVS